MLFICAKYHFKLPTVGITGICNLRIHFYIRFKDNQLFSQLVEQMKQAEGVDEAMKRRDQIGWVRKMNNIRARAEEIVLNEIIFQ